MRSFIMFYYVLLGADFVRQKRAISESVMLAFLRARYVEEGFDLGYPEVSCPGKAPMPYSHWWIYRWDLRCSKFVVLAGSVTIANHHFLPLPLAGH